MTAAVSGGDTARYAEHRAGLLTPPCRNENRPRSRPEAV